MLSYLIVRFKIDLSGATVVEYALLAAGIGLAVIAGVALMGDAVDNTLTEAASGL